MQAKVFGTPMNADAPPIAADKAMTEGFPDEVALLLDRQRPRMTAQLAFIGGNRRGIGVHRRFQSLSRG
ncbi:MAG: hypothetical protein FIB05_15210 [Betaproteobacteria bacterium]|nr:hypothetical protein [Betaproteobacteria bacterium]